MNDGKQAGWLTALALVVLFVSMWSATAGFVVSLFTLIGLAFWKNSQRRVKFTDKLPVYGILGVALVIMDGTAFYDIFIATAGASDMEIMILGASIILLIATLWWEKRAAKKREAGNDRLK